MSKHRTVDPTQGQPTRTGPSGVFQVVELEACEHWWESKTGVLTRGYTFNEQVPGPVVEATVGDTLLVRFTNRLPVPTAVRWHGLRLPAATDGETAAPVVAGETAEYQLALPDAGTFWYHPHPAQPSTESGGMYGALVVRDPADPELDGERVLILGDDHRDPRGCGSVVVNGVRGPHVEIQAGARERWRLVNASTTCFVRLSLGGHRFRVLATGGGLTSAPEPVVDLLLPPGGRYDVAVGPFSDDLRIPLEALLHEGASVGRRRHRLATLHVTSAVRRPVSEVSRWGRPIEALTDSAAAPTRFLRVGQRSARPGQVLVSGDPPSAVPVRVGHHQVWELVNDTRRDQPFHLHGFFFQVLRINETAPPYRSWEDTVVVPAEGRVRIAWLPDDRRGVWTYHYPALGHELGAQATFEVVP